MYAGRRKRKKPAPNGSGRALWQAPAGGRRVAESMRWGTYQVKVNPKFRP